MPSAGPLQQADRRRAGPARRPLTSRSCSEPPGDQLLDEVRQAALLARAEHGYHVRVRDLLRRGDLALEAPDEDLVLRELGRDDLDRHGVAAIGDALEDDAHPATPDGPGDPVGTYGIARPGLECDLRHTSGAKSYRLDLWVQSPTPELPVSRDLRLHRVKPGH